MLLRTPYKVSEPYNNPFWEKSNPSGMREREKKEKNAVNSGHLVPGQRSAAKLLGPIIPHTKNTQIHNSHIEYRVLFSMNQ